MMDLFPTSLNLSVMKLYKIGKAQGRASRARVQQPQIHYHYSTLHERERKKSTFGAHSRSKDRRSEATEWSEQGVDYLT